MCSYILNGTHAAAPTSESSPPTRLHQERCLGNSLLRRSDRRQEGQHNEHIVLLNDHFDLRRCLVRLTEEDYSDEEEDQPAHVKSRQVLLAHISKRLKQRLPTAHVVCRFCSEFLQPAHRDSRVVLAASPEAVAYHMAAKCAFTIYYLACGVLCRP